MSTTFLTRRVFISYRRDGGAEAARVVRDALMQRHFGVFMDVQDLGCGHFDKAILAEIEQSMHFVVVLTPGCLDRCQKEGDWLRKEVAQAIALGKNIVPVVMDSSMQWPELPPDMAPLATFQALFYSRHLHDASMDKLAAWLRTPKFAQPPRRVRVPAAIACAIVLVAMGIAAIGISRNGKAPRPRNTVSGGGGNSVAPTNTLVAPTNTLVAPTNSNKHDPKLVAPPTVRLRALSPLSNLVAPATVSFAVEASNDGLQQVEFQTNGVFLRTIMNLPFRLAWSGVAAGTYSVRAVATCAVTYNQAVKLESEPLIFTVETPFPKVGQCWTNSLGMGFVPLPGGGGWLSRYETRVADYVQFRTNHLAEHSRHMGFRQQSNEPAVWVDPRDATKFCQWLTLRERGSALLGPDYRYRLPKVAEWRQALPPSNQPAAASGKIRFLWGGQLVPPKGTGNLAGEECRKASFSVPYISRYQDDSIHTSPAGAFGTNSWGFCDLIGNVWELCEPEAGRAGEVPVMGGAWDTYETRELAAGFQKRVRGWQDNVGFRCLLVQEVPVPSGASAGAAQRNSK